MPQVVDAGPVRFFLDDVQFQFGGQPACLFFGDGVQPLKSRAVFEPLLEFFLG
ncbi:hypothetical protein LJB86_04455 [Deltaproteobacteria bacterium OttesenSCG-928-M10]|nr:hypothetical protein [Deltaproteobacteria bacterium OttesenSCG-928-M10]